MHDASGVSPGNNCEIITPRPPPPSNDAMDTCGKIVHTPFSSAGVGQSSTLWSSNFNSDGSGELTRWCGPHAVYNARCGILAPNVFLCRIGK